MKNILVAASLLMVCGLVSAREWTNTAGQKIQADLLEVKSEGEGGAEAAVLKMANGRVYNVPLDQLSEADRSFIRAEKERLSAQEPSVFKKALDGKLVAVNGRRVGKYEMESEPKYYAFYFSAHWCPPCRAFTPKFVEFYNSQEGKKKDFEVIFMNNDRSEEEMEEYMLTEKMPWPAVSFRNSPKMDEIRKLAGRGIPCLVVVDRDGKVLSSSHEGENFVGPYIPMNKIGELVKN